MLQLSFKVILLLSASLCAITISTLEDLAKIGDDTSFPMDSNYTLTRSIDAVASRSLLGENSNFPSSKGWNPIGIERGSIFFPNTSTRECFKGQFDGQGFVIKNLFSYRIEEESIGLFACLDSSAVIQNLGLIDVDITGKLNIGGIAGSSNGTIKNSYSTGSIVGRFWHGGGLVGYNSGLIENSWSASRVHGGEAMGGLVGENANLVQNSYSLSRATGGRAVSSFVGRNYNEVLSSWVAGYFQLHANVIDTKGPIVGEDYYNKTVTDSWWDQNVAEVTYSSNGGTGQTTSLMKSELNFINWDFNTIWEINESKSYPFLKGINNAPQCKPQIIQNSFPLDISQIDTLSILSHCLNTKTGLAPSLFRFNGESHMNEDRDTLVLFFQAGVIINSNDSLWGGLTKLKVPYKGFLPISQYEDLKTIGKSLARPISGNYKLTQNINASSSYSEDFEPIGRYTYNNVPGKSGFSGTLDGQGFSIDSLYIIDKDTSISKTGFFDNTEFGSEIRDLNFKNLYVEGPKSVAGLGSLNYIKLTNVHIHGQIKSKFTAAGITNSAYESSLDKVSFSGIIQAPKEASGIANYLNHGSSISNCWSNAIIRANERVAGIINTQASGYFINNCISYSTTLGDSIVGGFKADSSWSGQESNILGGYWSSELSTVDSSAGGVNLNILELGLESSFTEFNFKNIWKIESVSSFPGLQNINNSPIPLVRHQIIDLEFDDSIQIPFEFIDPDQDSLVYSFELPNHLDYSFENGIVKLKNLDSTWLSDSLIVKSYDGQVDISMYVYFTNTNPIVTSVNKDKLEENDQFCLNKCGFKIQNSHISNDHGKSQFVVIDVFGNKVAHFHLNPMENIDLKSMYITPGIYFIQKQKGSVINRWVNL